MSLVKIVKGVISCLLPKMCVIVLCWLKLFESSKIGVFSKLSVYIMSYASVYVIVLLWQMVSFHRYLVASMNSCKVISLNRSIFAY